MIPIPIVCGDGNQEGTEECDDGNLVDGDGCDSNCVVETPVSGMTEAECLLQVNMTWTGTICVCKVTYI